MADRYKVYPKDKSRITSDGTHIVLDLQTGKQVFEGSKAACNSEASRRNG